MSSPNMMKVTIPQGVYAGQKLRVKLPGNQLVDIVVPQGSKAGDQLQIDVSKFTNNTQQSSMNTTSTQNYSSGGNPFSNPMMPPPNYSQPPQQKNNFTNYSPPQAQILGIKVPKGLKGNDTFQMKKPDGQLITLTLPYYAYEGMLLKFDTRTGAWVDESVPTAEPVNEASNNFDMKMQNNGFSTDPYSSATTAAPVASNFNTGSFNSGMGSSGYNAGVSGAYPGMSSGYSNGMSANGYGSGMPASSAPSFGNEKMGMGVSMGSASVPMANMALSAPTSLPPFPMWTSFVGVPFQPIPYGVRRVQPGLPPPKLTGRKKALLIGINYKGTRAALNGCVNDVVAMQNFLMKQGFTNTAATMVCLMDNVPFDAHGFKPTKANIIKGLQWLVSGVVPGDILFFHYSGHGAQQTDNTGHEKDGLNETILPMDFEKQGMITDDQIWDMLVARVPNGVRLVALMDCCHCGTGMDLSYNWKNHANWVAEPNPSFSEGDVTLFSGCDDHQTSADAYNKLAKAPGGAMTSSFIKCWEQNPYQNVQQFMYSLHVDIKRRGFKQVPQLSSSQRWDPNRRALDLNGEIFSNYNEYHGKQVNKKFKPQKPNMGDSPLGPMLLAAGVGVLLAPRLFEAGADIGEGLVDGIGGLLGGLFDF